MVYDVEFKEGSILLFEKVKMRLIICVYSGLTSEKIFEAPEEAKSFFRDLKKEHLEPSP
jgi:hypothetical protein